VPNDPAQTLTTTAIPTTPIGVTRTKRPAQPWRRAWLSALATWGIAYPLYLMLNSVFWTVGRVSDPGLTSFLNVWNRWDTGHYIRIATEGYDSMAASFAFFPLYPILIAGTDPLLPGEKLAAGLVVASAACIAALAVIHRLAEDLFDVETARRTTRYLMLFPFAFFLVAAYNESLFVALSVASLYCMRRGRWAYAGVFAGLASATRVAGVLLLLPFVIEYLRQREWRLSRVRWDALAALLVPSGLLAFMVYQWASFGDALLFQQAQSLWGRELSWPWVGVTDAFSRISAWYATGNPFGSSPVLNGIDIAFVPLVAVLLVLSRFGRWRLGPQADYLVAYGVASFLLVLLVPMSGPPPLHGLPRFTLENLAVFLVLARMGSGTTFDRVYPPAAAALQAALLLGYFEGVFLA
jgi:Gpi18-like mannosyltransferase